MNTYKLIGTLIIIIFVSISAKADVTLKHGNYKYGSKNLESLILQNNLVKIVIVPSRGGRIAKFIDKVKDDVNIVSLPNDPSKRSYGGLLGEHGWVGGGLAEHYYNYKVLEKNTNKISIQLTPRDQEPLQVSKTITLYSGRPGIEIKYQFFNHSQETGSNILIKNVIWPDGKPWTKDKVKNISPLSNRVGKYHGKTGKLVAPWWALVSESTKRAVTLAFSNDLIDGIYNWNGSKTRPTSEWFYRGIPKGKQVSTITWVYITHGFSHISYAGKSVVASLKPQKHDGKIKINWKVAITNPDIHTLTLETKILDLTGEVIHTFKPKTIGNLNVNDNKAGEFSFDYSKNKSVIVRQIIYAGKDSKGKKIGTSEEFLKLRNSNKKYKRETDLGAKAQFKPVPGWQDENDFTVEITDKDKKRGFTLFSLNHKNAGKAIKSLHYDLAINELSTIQLAIKPLEHIDNDIHLSVTPPKGWGKNSLKVTSSQKRTTQVWGKQRIGWELTKNTSFRPQKNKKQRIYIIAHCPDFAKPGKYSAKLKIQKSGGDVSTIPINIKVWPLRLPKDRVYALLPNSRLNSLGYNKHMKDGNPGWDMKTVKAFANDLYEHGARILVSYGGHGSVVKQTQDLSRVKLRSNGKPLTQALKENPKLLQQHKLPDLDFSFWDSWLQVWIDRYFRRYMARHGYLESYLKRNSKFAKKHGADPDKVRRWLESQVTRYLADKGYSHPIITIGDEIASDKFELWAKDAKEAIKTGWLPGVTISNAFFANPKVYHEAGPLMGFWPMHTGIKPSNIKMAWADGYMQLKDVIATYTGSGTFWRDNDDIRRYAWQSAIVGADYFWVQTYIRKFRESIIFKENHRPYPSASWQYLAEGGQEANFIKLARNLRKNLKSNQQKLGSKLEKIIAQSKNADTREFNKLKVKLYKLVLEMHKNAKPSKSALLWQGTYIVKDGKPKWTIVAGKSGKKAANLLSKKIKNLTGVTIPIVGNNAGATYPKRTIFISNANSPTVKQWQKSGIDIGITKYYPHDGQYLIHKLNAGNSKIIAVIGRDDKGIELGVKNWLHLMNRPASFTNMFFINK